jgi:hypothetical protein
MGYLRREMARRRREWEMRVDKQPEIQTKLFGDKPRLSPRFGGEINLKQGFRRGMRQGEMKRQRRIYNREYR